MKTIKINLYQFSELSEDAKHEAVGNLSDINVNYEWWDYTYEDAANIGLKITGFDIDRGSYVNGKFTLSAVDTATKIVQEHGEMCETHKTALQFVIDYDKIKEEYADAGEDNWDEDNWELEELSDQFLYDLCEDYRIILQYEYEYQTSEKAIIEAIEANEYDFTEDGKLY